MWFRIAAVLSIVLPVLTCRAEQWEWRWTPGDGEGKVTAEVCPLRYDKQWAYSVEIDDEPLTALTVSQPFLAKFHYTDAPPGVPGGKAHPFVGSVAIFLIRMQANATFLSWDQVRQLQAKGWGVISHSYLHAGRDYGNPPEKLTPQQIRRDLYWSQTILATEVGHGRSLSQFVYPNGYMPYADYLAEFGLRGASRVNSPANDLLEADMRLLDLSRTHLDEGPWSKLGDPMQSFPPAGPKVGQLFIDFTHTMDAKPDSPNAQRWAKRMEYIAGKYGQKGADSMWCAPTADVVDYALASRAAKVTVDAGHLTLTLPESAPGSALTVKLTGVSESAKVDPPPGGVVYRQGKQVWVTTPMLGQAGSPAPLPHLKRIYQGPLKSLTWPKPQKIAGVRLHELGNLPADFELEITLTTPDGKTEPFVKTKLESFWGRWLLYSSIPDKPAPQAKAMTITANPSLKEMEVWVVDE